MPSKLHVWNGERAHVGRWRELTGIAVIAPLPGAVPLSPEFIEQCCSVLRDDGYDRVVTPALAQNELMPFMQAGFTTREQLFVLTHNLHGLRVPRLDGITLRRSRSSDLARTLSVDAQAFDDFWRFDSESLGEACTATPQTRFRVAVSERRLENDARSLPAGLVLGYCIAGRSRHQGFLQRLAVAPEAQGLGIGSALVWDALGWLFRRRSRTRIVNTQESNRRAMALYKACGFVESPTGLHVLTLPLEPVEEFA